MKHGLEHAFNGCDNNIDKYQKCFIKVLDIHASPRIKYIWGNQNPHLIETLREAIMKRSRLTYNVDLTENPIEIEKLQETT